MGQLKQVLQAMRETNTAMDQIVQQLLRWSNASQAAGYAINRAAKTAAGAISLFDRQANDWRASVTTIKKLLEEGTPSSEELGAADKKMHDVAQQLKEASRDAAAKEVEKLAGKLEEAARLQLKVEQVDQSQLEAASRDGRTFAEKLDQELGDMVREVSKKVDALLEHDNVQLLREALAKAKDAAAKLHAADKYRYMKIDVHV